MSAYIDIHPENPQPRLIDKVVNRITAGGTVAIPTDSGYAIACRMGNKNGLETIRSIRKLNERHNYSLLCESFAQLGQLVVVGNAAFRAIKAVTPGPYTFILAGTKEVPRTMLNKKKHTVGVRLPQHQIVQAILGQLGEPLMCSTLIMPGQDEPLIDGWDVNEQVGHLIDAVVEGPVGQGPTTVIDFTDNYPLVLRHGAGDAALFE